MSQRESNLRVIQAAQLLTVEANHLEQEFNRLYPRHMQDGRVTALLGLSNRIHLLRHLATQIESV